MGYKMSIEDFVEELKQEIWDNTYCSMLAVELYKSDFGSTIDGIDQIALSAFERTHTIKRLLSKIVDVPGCAMSAGQAVQNTIRDMESTYGSGEETYKALWDVLRAKLDGLESK